MAATPEDSGHRSENIRKRIADNIKKIVEKFRLGNLGMPESGKTPPVSRIFTGSGREIEEGPLNDYLSEDYCSDDAEMLKRRFYKKKLQDFIDDHILPLPTIICETERMGVLEAVRQNVLYCNLLKPFTAARVKPVVEERLDRKRIKDYGVLYILINLN